MFLTIIHDYSIFWNVPCSWFYRRLSAVNLLGGIERVYNAYCKAWIPERENGECFQTVKIPALQYTISQFLYKSLHSRFNFKFSYLHKTDLCLRVTGLNSSLKAFFSHFFRIISVFEDIEKHYFVTKSYRFKALGLVSRIKL